MDRKYKLFTLASILSDHSKTLQWLREIGLISVTKYCAKHKQTMTLYESWLVCGQFVCYKKNKYYHNVTVADKTRTKLWKMSHFSWNMYAHYLLLCYEWIWTNTFEQTIRESSITDEQHVSGETVADGFSFCREICMIALDKQFMQEKQMGRPGEIVEIGECKIDRRKYERGRIIEGYWLLGMILWKSSQLSAWDMFGK